MIRPGKLADGGAAPYTPRSPEQISRYFDGLELLPPGVVTLSRC